MKSKVWVIILAGVVLVGTGGYLLLGKKNKNVPPVTAIPEEGGLRVVPQPTGGKLSIWEDQAGFTFQYDPGLKINNHPEDKINYANLEITQSGQEGKVLVLASDTKYKTVADWVKGDKDLQGGLMVDAALGGKPAKKISFSDSGKVVVGAIDSQILFTLQVTGQEGDWKPIFEKMVTSFKFVYPTSVPSAGGNTSAGSGDIIEEEEIIE